jgi:FMN-dependent NADH-azoreductase
MSRLLLISTNLTGAGLKTRALAVRFIESLRKANPGIEVTERNLYAQPVPQLSPYLLSERGCRGSAEEERARLRSEALIAEVEAADTIVIAAPMQNFSVPSTLKAWIDHIARAGRTVRFTPDGPEGLLKNKTVFVATARSAYHADGAMSAHDFHEPYLRAVLRALGMEDVSFIYVEDQPSDTETAGVIAPRPMRRPQTEALAA